MTYFISVFNDKHSSQSEEGKGKEQENTKLPTVGQDQVRYYPRNLEVHRFGNAHRKFLRERDKH